MNKNLFRTLILFLAFWGPDAVRGQGVVYISGKGNGSWEKAAQTANAGGGSESVAWVQQGLSAEHLRNWKAAFQWFQKAAQAGNSDGMCGLADYYTHRRQWPEAAKWYWRSAAAGNSYGAVGLGDCYQSGLGVRPDGAKAVDCYKRSANAGNAVGQCQLGAFYFQRQRYPESAKWFELAAEQGNPKAESLLGDSYQEGFGVPKDLEKARAWFSKAAAQGDRGGQMGLARLNHQKVVFTKN
jgi:uncharacterized protein